MKVIVKLEKLEGVASAAHDSAKKKGLTYAGFGRYKDKSGKVTHKSVGGKLVAVKPKAGASFYGKHSEAIDRAKIKKHKESIIEKTAASGHKQWQADFKKANGKDAQRLKTTKDAEWIKKHGTDSVDIANSDYKDLPHDWKKENLESAKSAVEGLLKSKGHGHAAADKASSHVHDKWLERNGSWAPEHQKQPFHKLTKDEQDKDRFFVKHALKHTAKH